MTDYFKGITTTGKAHLGLISLALVNYQDKEVHIKFSTKEEAKTLQQLRLVHGLFRLLYLSGCLNEKLDDVDKVKYYFKFKVGIIERYVYQNEKGKVSYTDDETIAKNSSFHYTEVKSLAKCSKKELKELIEFTLHEADKHQQHGNLGKYSKKFEEIRNELDNRR